MRQRLRDVFKDFAEITTAHAPPKIVTHKHILSKLFWSVLFLGGLVVFFYFCVTLISTYLAYARTTDIELKFNVLEFPAVTVCNQNQFKKSHVTPELSRLLDDFLQSKRADMFGGRDKFEAYASRSRNDEEEYSLISSDETEIFLLEPTGVANDATPNPTAASAPTTAAAGTTAFKVGTTTAGGSTTPTPLPVEKRRRRRAVEYNLDAEAMVILEDMIGFYDKPAMADLVNMSWFDNVGQTSSEKDILLNLTQFISSTYSTQDLIGFGHNIQEMLQECVFMGKTCGPEDFYHFYDMKYGNCYTFNSGMNGVVSRVTNPGASFGLSMTLFVNQPEYIPVLTQEAGVRVLLSRQGQVPIMEEDGFDITPGTKSGIAVRYVEISRLAEYNGDCKNKADRNGSHAYYPGNYTQKGCLKTCLQNGIMKDCSCANPLYRYPPGYQTCGPADNACVEEVEYNLLDNSTCSNQCPTPCWESQYQYVISASQWPSNNYMPYLKESLDQRGDSMRSLMESGARTGLSQQFLKMNVYYDNLNYQKYSERLSMTAQDLIGALGGHLGLWIGMSMISFIEFFELILLVLKWCFCRPGNKTASMSDLGDDRENVETPVHSIKNSWVKDK